MGLALTIISVIVSVAFFVFWGTMLYHSVTKKSKVWFWIMLVIPITSGIYFFTDYRKKKRRKK